uniref:TENA_THI-4 domain-containing protein n=1 Tax=Steinernema glaseri TaxID=37863 RepID=A0A1I7XW79_9BILA
MGAAGRRAVTALVFAYSVCTGGCQTDGKTWRASLTTSPALLAPRRARVESTTYHSRSAIAYVSQSPPQRRHKGERTDEPQSARSRVECEKSWLAAKTTLILLARAQCIFLGPVRFPVMNSTLNRLFEKPKIDMLHVARQKAQEEDWGSSIGAYLAFLSHATDDQRHELALEFQQLLINAYEHIQAFYFEGLYHMVKNLYPAYRFPYEIWTEHYSITGESLCLFH